MLNLSFLLLSKLLQKIKFWYVVENVILACDQHQKFQTKYWSNGTEGRAFFLHMFDPQHPKPSIGNF